MYVLHPAIVHFPIALLLVNLLVTWLYIRRADPFFDRAAYGALVLGWWGTVAGIISGTLSAALEWPLEGSQLAWLNAHAVLGFALLFVYGRALLWRRRKPNVLDGPDRRRYLALLIGGALLVAVDGWVGGHMVYRLGFGR
jgi:uncharacterized membrane protein